MRTCSALLAIVGVGTATVLRAQPAPFRCELLRHGSLRNPAPLHRVELVPVPALAGVAGTLTLDSEPSPFGIAVDEFGHQRLRLVAHIAGLPAPGAFGGATAFVAWIASVTMDSLTALGSVRNGRTDLGVTTRDQQREYPLRDVYNALRWLVRAGAPWRYLPTEFPPWEIVYQQTQRWVAAGCFEALVHDLRALLRVTEDRAPTPSAVVLDGRTLQSTPESGARAGYDGAKRRKGSKVHMAVDTLGHLLALRVTAADKQERAQVGALANDVQVVTGETVTLAYADQGYTGATPADAALAHGIQLQVVKLSEAKRGFVLLPRRWVVERSFAWTARFRRLARDYERLPATLAALHFIVFASILLQRAVTIFGSP